MAFHFIAIVSDFSGGRRYGWHYSSEDQLDKEYIKLFITRIKKECGHVQFGIHKLTTDDISWDSVVQMDSFFDDVIITNRIDDFIEVVSNDQQLSAYDVAKFVLAIYPVSHLKLQKFTLNSYLELDQSYLKIQSLPLNMVLWSKTYFIGIEYTEALKLIIKKTKRFYSELKRLHTRPL